MALEQATYINQLVTANPQATDTVAQADDHIRLIKSTLKATFPNITGPVTVTQGQLNSPIPTGIIAMWSGAISSIPTGWVLCDGTNGTPNLRDRFIVGAGSAYIVGATGGANSVTLSESQIPTHTHTITASSDSAGNHTHSISDPGHTHAFSGGVLTSNGYFPGGPILAGGPSNTSAAVTNISVVAGGVHTHAIVATASSVGGSQAHENRPPYYALAYIMKV